MMRGCLFLFAFLGAMAVPSSAAGGVEPDTFERPSPQKAIVQILWHIRCGDWSRALGPLVTRRVLASAASSARHVVLANNVCPRILKAFAAAGIRVQEFRDRDLQRVDLRHNVPPVPRDFVRKLLAFNLPTFHEGDRVLLLDDDAIPVGTVDELFELPFERQELWAAPDPEPTFHINSGVVVFRVSTALSRAFFDGVARIGGSLGDSDQELFSYLYFVNRSNMLLLGGQYNSHVFQLSNDFRQRSHVLHERMYLKILHYTIGGLVHWCECFRGHPVLPDYLRPVTVHCCIAENVSHALAGQPVPLCHRGRVAPRPSPKVTCPLPRRKASRTAKPPHK
eukprot:EG_transcript_15300